MSRIDAEKLFLLIPAAVKYGERYTTHWPEQLSVVKTVQQLNEVLQSAGASPLSDPTAKRLLSRAAAASISLDSPWQLMPLIVAAEKPQPAERNGYNSGRAWDMPLTPLKKNEELYYEGVSLFDCLGGYLKCCPNDAPRHLKDRYTPGLLQLAYDKSSFLMSDMRYAEHEDLQQAWLRNGDKDDQDAQELRLLTCVVDAVKFVTAQQQECPGPLDTAFQKQEQQHGCKQEQQQQEQHQQERLEEISAAEEDILSTDESDGECEEDPYAVQDLVNWGVLRIILDDWDLELLKAASILDPNRYLLSSQNRDAFVVPAHLAAQLVEHMSGNCQQYKNIQLGRHYVRWAALLLAKAHDDQEKAVKMASEIDGIIGPVLDEYMNNPLAHNAVGRNRAMNAIEKLVLKQLIGEVTFAELAEMAVTDVPPPVSDGFGQPFVPHVPPSSGQDSTSQAAAAAAVTPDDSPLMDVVQYVTGQGKQRLLSLGVSLAAMQEFEAVAGRFSKKPRQ